MKGRRALLAIVVVIVAVSASLGYAVAAPTTSPPQSPPSPVVEPTPFDGPTAPDDALVEPAGDGNTSRVNITRKGRQARGGGGLTIAASESGRFVAFASTARNLPRLSKGPDIVVKDRKTGRLELGSLPWNGDVCFCNNDDPALSPSGRELAFTSLDCYPDRERCEMSSSMVPEDTNHFPDVFYRDLDGGAVELISVGFRGDLANGTSTVPSVGTDGRYVAFMSDASNLVPNDTNGVWDMFVRDRLRQVTERVSVGPHGEEGNGMSFAGGWGPAWMSADGRYTAFYSFATNLVPADPNGRGAIVYIHDRETGENERLKARSYIDTLALTPDGRYLAFVSGSRLDPGDTNGQGDIYVLDRVLDTTRWASPSSTGEAGECVPDCRGGTGGAMYPAISADGRYVAFWSGYTNLVPHDRNGWGDFFWHDNVAGRTIRVNINSTTGEEAERPCNHVGGGTICSMNLKPPVLVGNGRETLFDTASANLVEGDTNRYRDVFSHSLRP